MKTRYYETNDIYGYYRKDEITLDGCGRWLFSLPVIREELLGRGENSVLVKVYDRGENTQMRNRYIMSITK